MQFISDLHIHSRFSRATSKDLTPENLYIWARNKGITVLGTGDFTHPLWITELKEKLEMTRDGLYSLKDKKGLSPGDNPVLFMLSGEISCIYKKNGRVRKIHHLILLPDFEAVDRLNTRLKKIGNIESDGRPILGLDSRDLLEIVIEADERSFLIPAHIWTPWFSLFGSRSGFDSMEECFEDLTPHIHAVETGLSSDPPMNRMVSQLDRYILVSNSDAHSPSKLAREANIFDTDLSYNSMIEAMTTGVGFEGTIEFFPEEGKYHLDGHRKCGVRFTPEETENFRNICPVCGNPLTIGVLNRVYSLADRSSPRLTKPYVSLIPLPEVLSQVLGVGPSTKKVSRLYEKLLSELGSELDILLKVPLADIEIVGGPVLKIAIQKMRNGDVIKHGGYDGEYGSIQLLNKPEIDRIYGQMPLFETEKKDKKHSSTGSRKIKKRHIPSQKTKILKKAINDPILDPLNREQREAVLYNEGHLLVKAGPGTGKTLTLTHKIAYLVRSMHIRPENILALTFTRKAAEEMENRISLLLADSCSIAVHTFHKFCQTVLRQDGERIGLSDDFMICSQRDAFEIAEQIVRRHGGSIKSLRSFLGRLPIIKYDLALGRLDTGIDFFDLFVEYEEFLRLHNMVDMEDLMTKTLELFRLHPEVRQKYKNRFNWIFVDEYQDTSPVQVELLKMLVYPVTEEREERERRTVIFAIGDPDQAIYSFRGADVEGFHRFPQEFPGTRSIVFRQNYRSTPDILKAAAAVMNKKDGLESQSKKTHRIRIGPCRTDNEEAEMIVEQIERLMGGISHFSMDSGRVESGRGTFSYSFSDIAILYRLNDQGDVLEGAMKRRGIPTVRSGETPLSNIYPNDIIYRFLKALYWPSNPVITEAYLKLAEVDQTSAKRNFGAVEEDLRGGKPIVDTIDKIVSMHNIDISTEAAKEAVSRLKDVAGNETDLKVFLDNISMERGIDFSIPRGDRVALMTLHAAKGLEWPVVFICGCDRKILPCTLFMTTDPEEEKRLFYVGITRAKERLILSYSETRKIKGRVLETGKSRFIDLIPNHLSAHIERKKYRPKTKKCIQMSLFSDI